MYCIILYKINNEIYNNLSQSVNVKSKNKLNESQSSNNNNYNYTLDPTRKSTQESGIIKAYAVNTNEGLVRNYNEDRVSIILNIMQKSFCGSNGHEMGAENVQNTQLFPAE